MDFADDRRDLDAVGTGVGQGDLAQDVGPGDAGDTDRHGRADHQAVPAVLVGLRFGEPYGESGLLPALVEGFLGAGIQDGAVVGIPDANSNFLIQAGSSVMKTDGAGYARLTWPKPFPNGLLSVTAVNGDDWAIGSSGMTFAGSGNPVHGSSGYGNAKDWVYLMAGFATGSNDGPVVHLANKIHRINWIAIGW